MPLGATSRSLRARYSQARAASHWNGSRSHWKQPSGSRLAFAVLSISRDLHKPSAMDKLPLDLQMRQCDPGEVVEMHADIAKHRSKAGGLWDRCAT